ncbi:MAG TPA: pyruvate dehydrogenase (acetyl-transferring) E1 component subunit alpha [Xanthobacteraceae bacterium]|nr:pyruvate dehydrogenase (acetyl-transferring) E1 component subunit alpha [Xanthobacteraceae bacterium]
MAQSTIAAAFEVGYVRYLDETGKLLAPLPDDLQQPTPLVALYRALVRTRTFDAKAGALQRTGRLGTYASSLGQEAVSVGAASAMRPEDVLIPSFREHGAQLWRGASPTELFLYWGGDERGNSFANAPYDFPNCVPVGSHAPHAAGLALTMKLRKEPRAVVCIFGDGATSKGDVYEGMNFAGVWKLPVVFVVSNNQWAISVPLKQQTAAQTLAQKAIAAGIPGGQVDGNDVIAVRACAQAALARARNGDGPSVIEAVTYRLGDHTTADDASRYRADSEVSPHWQREPIRRLHQYLLAAGHWTKDDDDRLLREINAEIDLAAEAYLKTAPADPASVFDYTYAELPPDLLAQKLAALDELSAQTREAAE